VPCDVTRQEDRGPAFLPPAGRAGTGGYSGGTIRGQRCLGMFWETSTDEWKQIFEVNVIAPCAVAGRSTNDDHNATPARSSTSAQ